MGGGYLSRSRRETAHILSVSHTNSEMAEADYARILLESGIIKAEERREGAGLRGKDTLSMIHHQKGL